MGYAKLLSALAAGILAAGCVGLQKPDGSSVSARPEFVSLEAEPDVSTALLTAGVSMSEGCSCGFLIRSAGAAKPDTVDAAISPSGSVFSASVSELKPATEYFFAAFVSNGINTVRSEEKTFTTKELPPAPPPATEDDDSEPITIPDATFSDYILWHYDSDEDGVLTMHEAEAIEALDLGGDEIADLSGIEYFPNLLRLSCCASQEDEGMPGRGKITKLDISHNPRLEELNIENHNITEIDLSGNPNLSSFGFYNTPITSIDISAQQRLTIFGCGYCKLETIDLSVSPALEEAHLDHNRLKSITLGDHKKIRYLDCSGNLLETLDISGCKALDAVDCSDNPQLKVIYMNSKQKLGCLTCDEGLKIEYKD